MIVNRATIIERTKQRFPRTSKGPLLRFHVAHVRVFFRRQKNRILLITLNGLGTELQLPSPGHGALDISRYYYLRLYVCARKKKHKIASSFWSL